MRARKRLIVLVTVLLVCLGGLQALGQQSGVPVGPGSFAQNVSPQANSFGSPGNAPAVSVPGAVASSGPEQSQNPATWPNYPYPQYNNPYYDGGSPGNVVSGLIDWALSVPSYTWDRVSEFLDNRVFPRSAATYGGTPQVQTVAPGAPVQQPQSLPPANSYNPNGR